METLKSPHILTEPSFFIIGTIGVPQSLQETFEMTPSCSRRSNSASTFGRRHWTSFVKFGLCIFLKAYISLDVF
ncbi:hypothetical protein XENTR_v10024815 [Xenopus tropicalis]|nr:hypothetical protein XENTR_v10024815 [Xenopus tropicalis]